MELQHPDITYAMQTGYARGESPNVVAVWLAQEVRHEDAFPYVPHEEREEN